MFSTTYYPASPQPYSSRVFASSPLRPLSAHALNARRYPSYSSMSSPLSKPSHSTELHTTHTNKSPTPAPRVRQEKHVSLLRRQVTAAKDRHDARVARSRTASSDKKWDAKVEQVQYSDWLAEQRSWLRKRELEAESVYGHEELEEESLHGDEYPEMQEEDQELRDLLEFERASERVQIEEAQRRAGTQLGADGAETYGGDVDVDVDVDDWSEGDYNELLRLDEHHGEHNESQDTEMS